MLKVEMYKIVNVKEKNVRKMFDDGKLSYYYGGWHRSYTRHNSQRREKDRRSQEVSISLPYFHGKYNVEAYLDWEIKVEQLFACHHISEERKVPLATLNFQGYALYWWPFG